MKGTTMRVKKNGRLVNVEDAHISPKGTETSVLSKNLIPGDSMILNGGSVGTIVDIQVKVLKNKRYLTRIKVLNENRKTFVREIDGNDRVAIVEYPDSRFLRRAYSRQGNDRAYYVKRAN